MITESLAYHGSNGKVWNVVVIHDIKVNDIGAGFQHIVDFFTKPGKVC
jgi:hypothetical protein